VLRRLADWDTDLLIDRLSRGILNAKSGSVPDGCRRPLSQGNAGNNPYGEELNVIVPRFVTIEISSKGLSHSKSKRKVSAKFKRIG
jgi:hypothetical protein